MSSANKNIEAVHFFYQIVNKLHLNPLFRTQLIIKLCRLLQCKAGAMKNNNNRRYSWLEKSENGQNSDDILLEGLGHCSKEVHLFHDQAN